MYKYNSITFLLAALGVFLLVLETGNALKCYECNSRKHADCWAPTRNHSDFIVDCKEKKKDSRFVACRKVLQIVDFEVNGLPPDTRVIRSCAYEPQELQKCYQRSGFGGRQEVCACDNDDLCNNSNLNELHFGVILMSLAAFVLKFKS